ncbi:alkaline phosphatase family protein [Candidatus Palauibacter sp.]|uniref:alkaline phosphatase family protein n=1 Tax=Candidatus Palauibacter sp. TaxID=3101350 RepID=UPI003AF2D8C7
MHGSPWSHDTAVPLLLFRRGRLRGRRIPGRASHQDIGETLARLLDLPTRPDVTGRPLREAFSDGGGPTRPGLLAVLVLDAMRADYLDRYADLLPSLSRLAAASARFVEARVDYVPTNTSTAHTTISTRTDPAIHGIVGNTLYDRRTAEPTSLTRTHRPATSWRARSRTAGASLLEGGRRSSFRAGRTTRRSRWPVTERAWPTAAPSGSRTTTPGAATGARTRTATGSRRRSRAPLRSAARRRRPPLAGP